MNQAIRPSNGPSINTFLQVAALACLLTASGLSVAHGDAHAKTPKLIEQEQKPWGIAGAPNQATRTIEVRMSDSMRFTPNRVEVRRGETIRFLHRNDGKLMHEFVLGTKAELDEHAAQMKRFPGMEHDEPYMAHVAAGKTGEIVWTFNRVGEFYFGCLIAGHYDAGMVGVVKVAAK